MLQTVLGVLRGCAPAVACGTRSGMASRIHPLRRGTPDIRAPDSVVPRSCLGYVSDRGGGFGHVEEAAAAEEGGGGGDEGHGDGEGEDDHQAGVEGRADEMGEELVAGQRRRAL